jgi:predicted CopG family antitoxin
MLENTTTTIQIKKSTLEKLKSLKKELKEQTYDDIIEYLLKKEQDVPDSLFGFLKGKTTHYKHDERDYDHE